MRQARVRTSGKEVLSEEGGGKCQNDFGGTQAEIAQRCSRGEQHAKEKNLEDARVGWHRPPRRLAAEKWRIES
jgi:hypothetical protein